ncbi:putative motility protein [Bradyrhizobium sp. INPA01-394B]|uniref:Motility protein n=1 Tax=Bradyrhizobium campsiandrae TaxID=1729892 RepID=A0ABR7UG26_9BRAD|nr:putative motility protein [Bradyrhizobium campsiandrae]MBC9878360.1 putative motility protein [Bradyrhizobium campsiandrae]MBC9982442.1 putative motility protein [Bradyrhizobium campsiandrae]
MDTMAMVSTMLASQQGALQSNIAATLTKQNLDMEKSTVLTLLGAGQPSLANVGPGVGGNLNVTA